MAFMRANAALDDNHGACKKEKRCCVLRNCMNQCFRCMTGHCLVSDYTEKDVH